MTQPHAPTPQQLTLELFNLFDANHDHAISLTEVESALTAHANGHALNLKPVEQVFSALDANHDGSLSPAEVERATAALLDHVHGHAAVLLAADPHLLLAALGVAAHHDGWAI
jgi:hypothetical protein